MSRVPPYSRTVRTVSRLSPTGLSPALAARSSSLRLTGRLLTVWGAYRLPLNAVQPRRRNGGTLGTPTVWACTVSLGATPAPFYFLRVREMFQFPGLPPHLLCVQRWVTPLITLWGFPIRRSSAPSPRAAPRGISLLRHVLLRHERPRHPPDALRHGPPQRGVAPVAAHPCLLLHCCTASITYACRCSPPGTRLAAPRLPSSPGKVPYGVSSPRMRKIPPPENHVKALREISVKRYEIPVRHRGKPATASWGAKLVEDATESDAVNARHIPPFVVLFHCTCVPLAV